MRSQAEHTSREALKKPVKRRLRREKRSMLVFFQGIQAAHR